MDVLDFSSSRPQDQHSILIPHPPTSNVWADGGMYVPPTRTMDAPIAYTFKGSPFNVSASVYSAKMRTNGSHFELLKFPMGVLSLYPGLLELCINDEGQRTTSICEGNYLDSGGNVIPTATASTPGVTWTAVTNTVSSFPKMQGKVKVKPYVPYIREAVFYHWPSVE